MKETNYYLGVGVDEIKIAIGESAGLSLEDDYTVIKLDSKHAVFLILFKNTYASDKKSVVT